MARQLVVVPLKKSAEKKPAEQIADEETKVKKEMFKWADDLAGKVIDAALEEADLRFYDDLKDEELGSLDLTGDYDPILNNKTGARLSDAFEEFAETLQDKFKEPVKVLRRLYLRALRARWKKQKKEVRTDPAGTKFYGNYMTTKHGVWTKLNAGAPRSLPAWSGGSNNAATSIWPANCCGRYGGVGK